MLDGFATNEATSQFAKSHSKISNYKTFQDLYLSNVGVGTYLGNPDSATDHLVKEAIKQSVKKGVNVIDTAINYRAQKAERSVGNAIAELVQENVCTREQLFISTKNGYVTNDADVQKEFWQYINDEYTRPDIIKAGDISSGYHCMAIPYLQDQLERSLANLQLDCIDLVYLHNAAEGQLQDISKEEFLKKLSDVFEFYESQRSQGKIKYYGMATWECFRVHSDNPLHLFLEKIVDIAKQKGGENHGFRFIQLPYNLYYDQALLSKTQKVGGRDVTILEAAQILGVGVFTSVPLMQGRLLAPGVMPEFLPLEPSVRALQFIRSTPGVIAPLVGHKTPEHVEENLKIMDMGPLSEKEFEQILKKMIS